MNTGNRVLWSIIGLVLLAAGVLGVLASRGWLPFVNSDQPALSAGGVERWNSWGGWATAATIAAGLLLALLGFFLLRAQVRGRGGASMGDLRTDGARTVAGQTQVASSALNQALARDLEGGQVRQAAVRIVGKPVHPQLLVRLAVTQDADLAGLKGHVDRAVGRFATTSGLSPELAEVTIRVADRETARVR